MEQLPLDGDLRAKYSNALPYLSALPINEERLDLSILDRVTPNLAQRLLERLLHPATDIDVHVPLGIQNNTTPNQIRQLKALQHTFQHLSVQAEQWSVGFPLLVWQDASLGRLISAPLFLWRTTLQPAPGEGGDWIFHPTQNNKGYLNPILKSYLETRLDFQWNQTIGPVDTVDAAVLQHVVERLSELLDIAPLGALTVEAAPSVEQAPDCAWVSSLLLGQFEPLTAKDNRKLPKDLQAKHRQAWMTKLPALPCNAEQEEWLATVFAGHHCVVEGSAHTGKTCAITAALPSLLADQGTALIVLPNAEALKRFQAQLQTLGLNQLGVFSLHDPVVDKERLITFMERLHKHVRQLPNFDDITYSKQLHAYRAVRRQLTEAHRALHHPLLNGEHWTALVGSALTEHDQCHRHLLGRFLQAKDFAFTDEEYQLLCNELEQHYPFFAPLDALKHPLNALHGRFFAEKTELRIVLDELPPLVYEYRHRIQRLYERYLILIEEYAEHQQLLYRDWVARLEQQIDKIEGDLLLYNELYGEAFDKQSGFQDAKLKVLSLFSSRYQAIRAAKAQLLVDYQQLRDTYLEPNYLQTPFPDIKEEPRLADMALQLEKVRQELHLWRDGIPERIQDQTQALHAQSVLPAPFDQRVQQLESNLKRLVTSLNDAQILRSHLELPSNMLLERSSFLLQLILQCQKLENHWDDLAAYYRWRRSWRHLSQRGQRVIQGLVQAGLRQWMPAFQSWYYHQRLLRHYQPAIPLGSEQSGLPYEPLLTLLQQLRPQVLKKAERLVKERQSEQVKRIKREKDLSPSKVRRIFKNKQLKDLLEWIGLEHLGNLFPIVLTTAEFAPYFLPAKVPIVDWVILDDAHLLPEALGTELLQLGNQHLVFGEPLDPTGEQSTLTWMLQQQGRKHLHFTELYTPDTPTLLAEGNHATKRPEESATPTTPSPTTALTPFHEWLLQQLRPYIGDDRLVAQARIEDNLVVDLLIKPQEAQGTPHAIWLDGGLLHRAPYDFERAVLESQRLKTLGYDVVYEWSLEWWQRPEEALEQFLTQVLDQPLPQPPSNDATTTHA